MSTAQDGAAPQSQGIDIAAAQSGSAQVLSVDLRSQPLPVLAWCRIIDRAQRGIGDASYNSDDDDVAQQEAADERPRGELVRIVHALQAVPAAGLARPVQTTPSASEVALARAKQHLLHQQ